MGWLADLFRRRTDDDGIEQARESRSEQFSRWDAVHRSILTTERAITNDRRHVDLGRTPDRRHG